MNDSEANDNLKRETNHELRITNSEQLTANIKINVIGFYIFS